MQIRQTGDFRETGPWGHGRLNDVRKGGLQETIQLSVVKIMIMIMVDDDDDDDDDNNSNNNNNNNNNGIITVMVISKGGLRSSVILPNVLRLTCS